MRRWSLLELYALLVCFMAIIGLATALFWLCHGVATLLAPDLTVSSGTFLDHQSNERYWGNRGWSRYASGGDRPKPPSEEALTAERERSWQSVLVAERRQGAQEATAAGLGVVAAVGFFWPHWRLARRARQEDREWVPPPDERPA